MMKLRVLTYNVFFEPVCMELRMKAIGRVIERARPAIVGFQEVTRDSLAMLKKQVMYATYQPPFLNPLAPQDSLKPNVQCH